MYAKILCIRGDNPRGIISVRMTQKMVSASCCTATNIELDIYKMKGHLINPVRIGKTADFCVQCAYILSPGSA